MEVVVRSLYSQNTFMSMYLCISNERRDNSVVLCCTGHVECRLWPFVTHTEVSVIRNANAMQPRPARWDVKPAYALTGTKSIPLSCIM